MNKVRSGQEFPTPKLAFVSRFDAGRLVRILLIPALCLCAAVFPHVNPRAQRKREQGVNVTGIASSAQGRDAVVSISGDGAMSHAQTWQDRNGEFHVIVPYGKTSLPARGAGGVRVQRVGDSLEIIVPTRPGAGVTVRPGANRLELVVSGGLAGGEEKAAAAAARGKTQAATRAAAPAERAAQEASSRNEQGGEATSARRPESSERRDAAQTRSANEKAQPAPTAGGAPTEQSGAPVEQAEAYKAPEASAETNTASSAATRINAVGEGMFSSATSWLLPALGLGGGLVAVFLVARRRRAREELEEERIENERQAKALKVWKKPVPSPEFSEPTPFEPPRGDRRKSDMPIADDRRRNGSGAEDQGTRFTVSQGALVPEGRAARVESRVEFRGSSSALPSVLFGAYRIDQEVSKLIEGLPHSIEVLASRASDDRRAIETSLVKILDSPHATPDGKRRARQALEDYGFVARQSAALLLATDTYDRLSAARVLGQVRASVSLPFLLEALYDADVSVRSQVVTSLGALGLPRAIGALLDMARRYPDIPSSVVAPALTACSFETRDLAWTSTHEGRTLAQASAGESATHELTQFEGEFEQLPEWLEDDNFADALERFESADVEMRIAAAQSLARFRAGRSVAALAVMSARDESPAVRAAAVTSLGVIDHESVFAPVLLALADDAREVCAAAARAFSSIEFDRADACARAVEVLDDETLGGLARACVKSGLAAQSLERLAGEDRRQAYEAFSLLSLVARGGEWGMILDAADRHRNPNVRLAAVRLAGLACVPELSEGLRELAGREGLSESIRVAILEAVGGAVGETAKGRNVW